MARSDLLVSLVRSTAVGDLQMFRRTVEAIVAEERAKQHHVVADRLERALRASNGSFPKRHPQVAESPTKARELIAEIVPRRRVEDLILTATARRAVEQLIEEQQRASLLRSHGLEPRHSVLLVGPPGNGKTSLAEALAEALAVPFFVVRYETMMGSFLGETAARLKRVFDYARTTPCVLFFDEFDAVGKERGDVHETGEIKRVVTSLLMQIDDLPSYVVIVAATNHAELLDRAVWRRFELRIALPAPTSAGLAEFIASLSHRLPFQLGMTPRQIATALGKVSYAEAEQFIRDVARRQVLSVGEPATDIAKEQLRIWKARPSGADGDNTQ